MALNRWQKGLSLTVWELNQEGRACLAQPHLGTWVLLGDKFFITLLCLWMTMKSPWRLTLDLQISFSEWVNLQIQNPQMMRINCVLFNIPKRQFIIGAESKLWSTRIPNPFLTTIHASSTDHCYVSKHCAWILQVNLWSMQSRCHYSNF